MVWEKRDKLVLLWRTGHKEPRDDTNDIVELQGETELIMQYMNTWSDNVWPLFSPVTRGVEGQNPYIVVVN